jgi:hypothetical protein
LRPPLWQKQNLLIESLPRLRLIAQLDDFNHHLPCTGDIGSKTHLLLFIEQGLDFRVELTALLLKTTSHQKHRKLISITSLCHETPTTDSQNEET